MSGTTIFHLSATQKTQTIFIHSTDFCRNVMMNTTAEGHYYSDNGYGFNFSVKPLELDKPTFKITTQDYLIHEIQVTRGTVPTLPIVIAVLTLIELTSIPYNHHTVRAEFDPVQWRSTFDEFTGLLFTVSPF